LLWFAPLWCVFTAEVQDAQGSKLKVLGSGYQTAFVRFVHGSANACEGTVPIASVGDQ
jgi:hypothetical protein